MISYFAGISYLRALASQHHSRLLTIVALSYRKRAQRRCSAVADNHRHIFGSFRVASLLYWRGAQTVAMDGEGSISAAARCAFPAKFSNLRLSPAIVSYAPLDGLVTTHLSTSCVQDYMQLCAESRFSRMVRVPVHQGDHASDGEAHRNRSRVAMSANYRAVRDVEDVSPLHEFNVEHGTGPALDSGAENPALLDSIQWTKSCDQKSSSEGAAFSPTILGTKDAVRASARENAHEILDTSDEIFPHVSSREVAQGPIELAGANPHSAKELRLSIPRGHQPLHSKVPRSRERSRSLPQPSKVVSFSGIVSPSSHLRDVSAEHVSVPAEGPESAHVRGSGLERTPQKLTRQERNRRAAARSNEKRRLALKTLELNFEKAKAECRALKEREAKAKTLNRMLKEEAAKRWTVAASTR